MKLNVGDYCRTKDGQIEIIIDNLKNIEDYFSFSEASNLLNYITNLQEENQRLKESIRLEEVQFKAFDLANECDEKQDLIDIYKSRIEKAVEYINTHYLNANEPKLLNILNGGDDNELD